MFCKRINRTQPAVEIWVRAFEERKTNDLYVQQNLYTTTTTINRGFTPNGINNECVSNSSKKEFTRCKIKYGKGIVKVVRFCKGLVG